MFHSGDLQSGITAALRDSKMVACFVKDDGEESKTWENEWLKIEEIAKMLSTKTVLLKLQGGSQDAGYLAAICPIPKTPTLVIIHNGQLREYLISGVTREAFVSRLTIVFKEETPTTVANTEQACDPQRSRESGSSQTSAITQSPAALNLTIQSTVSAPTAPISQSSPTTQALPYERPDQPQPQAQSTLDENDLEAAEATQRKSKKSGDVDHAALLKRRQKDAREERARILKRVEDDKAERRNQEVERKAEIAAASNKDPTAMQASQPTASSSSSEQCAIQVRLFDGTTIRSRFPSSNNLRTEVRRWIDEQKVGDDTPYSLRQVLTPNPNRIISIHEEEETLQSIGLTPSATLILVPVKEFASAYGISQQGLISRGATTGYSLISSGIGLVTSALGSILGRSEENASSASSYQESHVPAEVVPSSNARVRTLRDQRDAQEDHQLYNGNTLNFEPRRDEENDKTD